MTESELRTAFELQIPSLRSWGELVMTSVVSGLETELGSRSMEEFLKLPPKPRVKDIESFIAKAMFREKHYQDAMIEITDKVGVRFVTLLVSEIQIVSKVVEACRLWRFEKARDFESERRLRPNQFDYQSQHYVVYSTSDRTHGGVGIPVGLACEIQIRTLLQHAFAELAHDTTYKPKLAVDPLVKREVAKTSALIETTDGIFDAVSRTISEADHALSCVQATLERIYLEIVGCAISGESKTGIVVLDAFRDRLTDLTETALRDFFREKAFLIDNIRNRCSHADAWFSQPVILAVYYLVKQHPREVATRWPLFVELLKPIYKDLGLSLAAIGL